MVTPNDIADRLEELVGEEFPGEPVYRELVPSDFQRPGTLIVQEKAEGSADFGCNLIEMTAAFTLTTYVPVDEYHHSHLAELHNRQMRLVKLLLPGYIRVGDRAPKVRGKVTMAGGYDYDTVTVTFAWTLDRGDFMNIPQQPLMEQLHLNEEVRTYG